MYSLRLTCPPDEAECISAELWEAGTAGIHEIPGDEATVLIAAFETNSGRSELLRRFARFSPDWTPADTTDWLAHTLHAWPARAVGNRLFLAPPWSQEKTPPARLRIIHNPGLACGTGEHPCTRLALTAIEDDLTPGELVADIGAGSGILAIAALRLGARIALAVDPDEAALHTARENFAWNQLESTLIAGSADCLPDSCADLTVANINATVLLSIYEELLRITRPGGRLILTGFLDTELPALERLLPAAHITEMDHWRCIATRTPARSPQPR